MVVSTELSLEDSKRILTIVSVPWYRLRVGELLSGGWLPLGRTGAGSELCQSCSYARSASSAGTATLTEPSY